MTMHVTSEPPLLIDEPARPPRARRPLDVVRMLLAGAGTVAVVALALTATATTEGLGEDLSTLRDVIPRGMIELIAFASVLVGLILPIALVGSLFARRQPRSAMEALAGALTGLGLAVIVSAIVTGPAPARVVEAFTPPGGPGGTFDPIPAFPAFLVAAVSVVGVTDRRRLRDASVIAVLGGLLTGILDGTTTVPGALVAVGLGRIAGLTIRLVAGVPTTRPGGQEVAAALQRQGVHPLSLHSVNTEGPRHYLVETDAARLSVIVLDRERQGAGLLAQLGRMIRSREEVVPREAVSLRGALERRALVAYAFAAAGVRTPRLVTCTSVGSEAALLAYEQIDGRHLNEVADAEITDELLVAIWQQVRLMHTASIAHKRLTGQAVLVDQAGRPWIVDRSGGEVAASDLAQRIDVAQLIVETSRRVGAARAVATAAQVMGKEVVGRALPLVQPIALTRETRQAIRGQRGLLREVRDQIEALAAPEEVEEVRLERFRPRALLSGAAAVVAVYLVVTQLGGVDIAAVTRNADLRWIPLALLAVVATYIGASYALLGFVPERLPFRHVLAAQVALSYVRLLAPATISNAAVNIRLLTRSGVPTPLAGASVAAAQLTAFLVSAPLLVIFGVLTGRSAGASLTPSPLAIGVGVAIIVVLALLSLIPAIRSRARVVWSGFVERGLPRLLDTIQQPRQLAMALGGNLMLTFGYVLCLDASVRAFGGEASFVALAVVYVTGNTVGTAVPTPGGLGAVEAALTAGLGAAGVGAGAAVPAVLLFRLLTFWVPIIPGWWAWNRLQRRGLI